MSTQYTVAKGDTLNSIASKYGYSSYKAAGISGYGANPDLITPGMVLTINGSSSVPAPAPAATQTPGTFTTPSGAVVTGAGALVSPPPAATDPSITAAINAGQTKDYSTASAAYAPPTRGPASSITDIVKELKTVLAPSQSAPTPIDYEAKYAGLRSNYGVDSLETQLQGLNAEANAISADVQKQRNAERGKPVAMNVIEGRISQEEQAANERLTLVNNQIKTVSDQLTTKYNIINSIMGYAKQTYADAKDSYDTAYTRNVSLINAASGLADKAKSAEQTAVDDARANLQVIYNNITSNGSDPSNVSPEMQATITKLEIQAGLPAGFYSSLQTKNPKADILSTTTRTSGSGKYADVVMRNADGSLSTKSIYIGADTSSGDKPTEAETVRADAKKVSAQLAGRAGADGYVSPDDYKVARRAWVNAGYDAQDFDVRFAKTYVNPESYDVAGVSTKALD